MSDSLRTCSASIPELVHEHARKRPDDLAIGDISYHQLDSWTTQIARQFLEWGLRPGDRVATRLSVGPEFVAAFIALMKVNIVIVPLASSSSGWDQDVLRGQPPKIVIVSAASQSVSARSSTTEDQRLLPRFESSQSILDQVVRDQRELPASDLDAPCYTVFTSGSTGRPKAITQTHRAFTELACWMAREFQLTPPARCAMWASTNYDASLCEIAATLAAGGTLIPIPEEVKYNGNRLLDWMADQRVNVLQTVPSFARELVYAVESAPGPRKLPPLSCLLLTGEALPGDLASALKSHLPTTRLINLYGPTETILATWMEVSDQRWSGTVPVGHAIPGYRVFVVGEDDRLCHDGSVGEIVICAPTLSSGYTAGADEDGVARFRPFSLPAVEGLAARSLRCYRTGDLGRWRADGLLEWLGRADRQVKLRGTRVEPAEIEAAAISHPAVIDCVVVGVSSSSGLVDRLVAYVVAGASSISAKEMHEHLSRRLDADLMPSEFIMMPSLPRNSGGKVDLSQLPRAAR